MAEAIQHQVVVMEHPQLRQVVDLLLGEGYEVVGPTVRENAIVYAPLATADDLPIGWTDEQDAGTYRLKRREDGAFFGYALGPRSWKQFLFPPSLRLWQAVRTAGGFHLTEDEPDPKKYAFIGVRSCELHAIAALDRVLLGGRHTDEHYRAAREDLFIVAVNCGSPGGTCFCVSMGTGPGVAGGFDLALTEVLEGGAPYFLVEPGTERGRALLARVPHRPASAEEVAAGEQVGGGAQPLIWGERWIPSGSRTFCTATRITPAGTR